MAQKVRTDTKQNKLISGVTAAQMVTQIIGHQNAALGLEVAAP